jgi:hypothetical protein
MSSDDSPRRWPLTDRMVRGAYALSGDVAFAPREVAYAHDGRWWRAWDAATGENLWLTGPEGIYWDFDQRVGPKHAAPNTPVCFAKPVLPELHALASVTAVQGWLDVVLAADPVDRNRWTGRTRDASDVVVVTDSRTSLVLRVDLAGPHRRFALKTTGFALEPTDPNQFLYRGPSQPWRRPVAAPLPPQ